MRYTKILICFAFFAFDVWAEIAPSFGHPVQPNRNSVDVDFTTAETVVRKKRDAYNTFVDRLIDQFLQMKPLEVEGMDAASFLGPNRYRGPRESANALFSKGVKFNNVLIKDDRLVGYAEELDTLNRMNNNLKTYEGDFINDLETSLKKKIEKQKEKNIDYPIVLSEDAVMKGLQTLRKNGIHNKESEKVLTELVGDDHRLRIMVINNIEYLRGNREFIEMITRGTIERMRTVMSQPLSDDVRDYLRHAVRTLEEMRLANFEWLKYKTNIEKTFGKAAQITAAFGPDARTINDAEKEVKTRLFNIPPSNAKTGKAKPLSLAQKAINEEKEKIDKMYDKVTQLERDLFSDIEVKSDNNNIEQITNINVYGYKNKDTEKGLLKLLKRNPEMTKGIVSKIALIKKLREEVQVLMKEYSGKNLEHGKEDARFKLIRIQNTDWLNHKTDKKLDKLINAEYEKLKDEKV